MAASGDLHVRVASRSPGAALQASITSSVPQLTPINLHGRLYKAALRLSAETARGEAPILDPALLSHYLCTAGLPAMVSVVALGRDTVGPLSVHRWSAGDGISHGAGP